MKKSRLLATILFSLFATSAALASSVAPNANERGPGEGEEVPCIYNYDVQKHGPRKAYYGQEITYKIYVKNLGNCPLYDLRLTDYLPKGVEVIGAWPKPEHGGGGMEPTEGSYKLKWRGIDLGVGDVDKFVIKVRLGKVVENERDEWKLRNRACATSRFLDSRVCDTVTTKVRKGAPPVPPSPEDIEDMIDEMEEPEFELMD